MVVIFAAMWQVGHGNIAAVSRLFGDEEYELVRGGQWWRLVTPIFLHGSVIHIGGNGLSLYWIGSQMEWVYGRRKYFLIFLCSGITGCLLSYAGHTPASLGASGAIFGLVGAGLAFPIRFRSLVPPAARSQILSQLLFITLLNLGIGYGVPGERIDNLAHVGGLMGGLLAGAILIPDVLQRRPPSRAANLAVSGATAAGVVLVIACAAAQAHWARSDMEPALVTMTFTPPHGPATWQLRVPEDWTRTGRDWRSPHGAVLQVADSQISPAMRGAVLRMAVLLLMQYHTPQGAIEKRPALTYTVSRPPIIQQGMLVFYGTNEVVSMLLQCPKTDTTDRREFTAITSSLHFLVPLPVPQSGGRAASKPDRGSE